MVLITLRAAEEVRTAEFGNPIVEVDDDMVAVAETIIQRRTGHFDPAQFRDRYQNALRELIEAKLKGRRISAKPNGRARAGPRLMAALKCSLQQESKPEPKRRARAAGDRRQRNLLLPVAGSGTRRKKGLQVARPRQRKNAG